MKKLLVFSIYVLILLIFASASLAYRTLVEGEISTEEFNLVSIDYKNTDSGVDLGTGSNFRLKTYDSSNVFLVNLDLETFGILDGFPFVAEILTDRPIYYIEAEHEGNLIGNRIYLYPPSPVIDSFNVLIDENNALASWSITGSYTKASLYYENDNHDYVVLYGTDSASHQFDMTEYPGGQSRLKLVVHNLGSKAVSYTDYFSSTDNNPEITIYPNKIINRVISASAFAIDREDGLNLNIEWFLDGNLIGQGDIINFLSDVGTYELKAVATDSAGNSAEDTTIVTVMQDFYTNFLSLSRGWNMVSFSFGQTKTNASVSISPGWNLIGYSSEKPFYWLDAVLNNGTEEKTIEEAQSARWLQGTIYYYDPIARYYKFIPGDSNYLEANKAYWLYAFEDELTLTLPNAGGSLAENSFYWLDAQLNNGTETKSVTEAQSSGWLQATIYYYDPAAGYYKFIPGDTNYVGPWKGYWLYSNKDNLALEFP